MLIICYLFRLLIYVINFQNVRMILITNVDVEGKPKAFVGTIQTFPLYIARNLVSFALCREGE